VPYPSGSMFAVLVDISVSGLEGDPLGMDSEVYCGR
jgi:hypothetical protein